VLLEYPLFITVKLRGGLGNQLFQFFAGAYYARKFESQLKLDGSALFRHKDITRRAWIQKIDLQNYFPDLQISWKVSPKIQFARKNLGGNDRSPYLEEKDLEVIKSLDFNINVFDWFHSKKYAPIEKRILLIKERESIHPHVQGFCKELKIRKDSAAIHIRLGDFKNTSWGTLSSEWYSKSIEQLARSEVREVDCYSDDINDAKEILKPLTKSFVFNFPETKSSFEPHELLFALSNYKYFVSSNSTLSWWASYFNTIDEQRILCSWGSHLLVDGWEYVAK